ncbi:hypothetical protein BH09PSE1_BH09PSE1_12410 [soil metagenome]
MRNKMSKKAWNSQYRRRFPSRSPCRLKRHERHRFEAEEDGFQLVVGRRHYPLPLGRSSTLTAQISQLSGHKTYIVQRLKLHNWSKLSGDCVHRTARVPKPPIGAAASLLGRGTWSALRQSMAHAISVRRELLRATDRVVFIERSGDFRLRARRGSKTMKVFRKGSARRRPRRGRRRRTDQSYPERLTHQTLNGCGVTTKCEAERHSLGVTLFAGCF